MRAFLVKLREVTGTQDFSEAYLLVVTDDLHTLNDKVKELSNTYHLNLLSVEEVNIGQPNVVLISQKYS